MHRVWRNAQTEVGRLLRVLLLRLCSVPSDPGGARGAVRGFLLSVMVMNNSMRHSKDLAGGVRTYGFVWGLPIAAIFIGLFAGEPARTVVWILALAWMGTACILNARRCGRTHCRYTGPYYLLMIIPVLALGSGAVSLGFPGWLALAVLIVLGSKIIWWATERMWGKFS